MERTNWLCEPCLREGKVTMATVVNHILPLAHGGEDVDENTENLCKACDERVTAEQFGYKKRLAIGNDGWPIR
jgi:5-methylcytosine-specific restriction protein A